MSLPTSEQAAIDHAVDKLAAFGPRLPFPYQSKVVGAENLRELRPRQGRSPWRPLYRRITERTFVIAAIAPEAHADQRGFKRAVKRAEDRLRGAEE